MATNVLSLRMILLGLAAGIVVGAPLGGMVWEPLFWIVGLPVFLVVWLGLANSGLATRCPHCLKRVKLGASVCHRCGRDTAAGSPSAAGAAGRR